MLRRSGAIEWVAGCLLALAISSHASAQASPDPSGPSSYDTLIEQASEAYRAQQFERARDLFEQAHLLQPSARTLRGLGITAFALNDYTHARPELEASLVDPRKPLPRDQRREVTEILQWMRQALGTLNLELSPPHALARIDDRAVSAGTNELEFGEHQLRVNASGFISREQTFSLERDHPLTLRIELAPEERAQQVREHEIAAPIPVRARAPAASPASEAGSVLGRWWFWTIAGVVIASSVITVWAITNDREPRALPQGVRLSTQ